MLPFLKTFAPLAYQIGFFEQDFETVASAYKEWRDAVARGWTEKRVHAGLGAALTMLQPLTSPQNRELLISTASKWTAYFNNGLRLSDPDSPVGHLCTVVPCRGVVIHCDPDRSWVIEPKALRIYGCAKFTLFAPREAGWLNVERHVSALNDGGKWVFASRGAPLSFERTERYEAGKIADRFDCGLIEDYCHSLGIRPFDEEFYGGTALIGFLPNQLAPNSPRCR